MNALRHAWPRSKIRRRIKPYIIASPFGLRSAGYECLPPDYGRDLESTPADFTALCIPAKGQLCVDINGKTHEVRPGHLIIITEGTARRIFTKCEGVKYFLASYTGAAAPFLTAGFNIPVNRPFQFRHSLQAHLNKFKRDIRNPGLAGEHAGVRHLIEMLIFIAKHVGKSAISAAGCNEDAAIAARAIATIQMCWREKSFGVAQLAEMVGVNTKTLYIHFKAETGLAPKEYIDQYRLQHVLNMLQTRAKIQDIAGAAGFGSSGYLAKFFKRKMGVAPANYHG